MKERFESVFTISNFFYKSTDYQGSLNRDEFSVLVTRRQKDLAEEFFDKSEENAVGFEITLAAFLATALLTYPVSTFPLFSRTIAFLLLAVTLVRRVSQSSPYAPESKIDKLTSPIIEIATTLALVSLVSTLSMRLSTILSYPSKLSLFAILSFILVALFALLHEWIFYDYLIWWYAKFSEKSSEDDFPQFLWRDMSIVSYSFSKGAKDRISWNKIPKAYKPNPDEIEMSAEQAAKGALVGAIFLIGVNLPALVLTVHVAGFVGIFLVFAVVFLHDHACFWYIAYGNTSYEDFRKVWYAALLWPLGYSIIVLLLFNEFPILI